MKGYNIAKRPPGASITQEHLKLAANLEWRWEDCEYGAPAVDCKRPYGNSDVEHDIARILDMPLIEDRHGEPVITREQVDRIRQLHADMLWVIPQLVEAGIDVVYPEKGALR